LNQIRNFEISEIKRMGWFVVNVEGDSHGGFYAPCHLLGMQNLGIMKFYVVLLKKCLEASPG
jgi:hypothetical protein